MDTVQQDLYSLVLTEKDGIYLDQIEREYTSLTGKNLIFDRTKYRNLESFIMDMPDHLEIINKNYSKIVVPIVSKKVATLRNLINNQKTSTKKKPKTAHFAKGPSAYRFSHSNKPRSNYSNSYYDNKKNYNTRVFDKKSSFQSYRGFNNNSNYENRRSSRVRSPTPERRRSSRVRSPTPERRRSSRVRSPTPERRRSSRIRSPTPERRRSSRVKSPTPERRRSSRIKSPTPDQKKFSRYSSQYSSNNLKKKEHLGYQKKTILIKNFEKKKEQEEKIDYKLKLKNYLDQNKELGEPKFLYTIHLFRTKTKGYFSKLFVGERSWLTFPLAFKSLQEAENHLSKIALEDLKKNIDKENISEVCDDFIEDLLKLLKNDESFFTNHLSKKYYQVYNKNLPDMWIDQIEKSKKFDFQIHQIGNKVMKTVALNKNYDQIINQFENLNIEKNSKLKNNKDETIKEDKKNVKNKFDEQNKDKENKKDFGIKIIEEVKKLEKINEEIEVIVLRVNDNNELVLRLKKNSSELEELISKLHKFYVEEKKGEKVKEINLNEEYAAVFPDAVFRVKPLLFEGKKVNCFFIDDGVYEKINLENLHKIYHKFLKLPPQAFFAQLDGFENLKKTPKTKKFLDEKINDSLDYLCLKAKITCSDPIKVCVYETTNENLKINLNEKIIEYLEETNDFLGSQLSIPKSKLPNNNEKPFEVMVSMPVNPQNFVLIDASNFKEDSKFYKFNLTLQKFYDTEELIDLNITMVYQGLFVCVKEPDEKWYRARVESLSSDQNPKITCYLADTGKIILTDLEKIQPLYSQFTDFPMIAIKASLKDVAPITEDWDPFTTYEFNKLVNLKSFNCTINNSIIIDQEYNLIVTLYDLKSEDNLSKTLVDKKIVKLIN